MVFSAKIESLATFVFKLPPVFVSQRICANDKGVNNACGMRDWNYYKNYEKSFS